MLKSDAVRDNCGVCKGDNSTCELIKSKIQITSIPESSKGSKNNFSMVTSDRKVNNTKKIIKFFIKSENLTLNFN